MRHFKLPDSVEPSDEYTRNQTSTQDFHEQLEDDSGRALAYRHYRPGYYNMNLNGQSRPQCHFVVAAPRDGSGNERAVARPEVSQQALVRTWTLCQPNATQGCIYPCVANASRCAHRDNRANDWIMRMSAACCCSAQ